MIPADLASHLRVLAESSVQPLGAVHEIPADLPRLEAGQRFTALIQNPLPDGTFRALIAGKTMTLALPDSAKSGDVLELMVTEQKGATIFARTTATPPASAGDLQRPVLSQTGQLISQLLTGRFGESAPIPLTKGTSSLLPSGPQTAAELAPLLKQTVSKSGLFYESHLRQWADGQLPLTEILDEPQAQQTPFSGTQSPLRQGSTSFPSMLLAQSLPEPAGGGLPAAAGVLPGLAEAPAEASSGAPPTKTDGPPRNTSDLATNRPAEDTNASRDSDALRPRSAKLEAFAEQAGVVTSERRVAESLLPLVHQQLDALATHQMCWQGQVWPGAQMQWDIINPDQQGQTTADEEEPAAWRSTLRLSLPQLGEVQAQLVLGSKGLSLRLDAETSGSAQRLRAAQTELLDALQAAGIVVTNLQVSEHVSA